MSLLDLPEPRLTGEARVVQPLGKWPADPSPEKREAQRVRAIAAAAKRREMKEAA